MKTPKIMKALGFVDDELIEEAADQTAEADATTIETETETAATGATEKTGNAATEETMQQEVYKSKFSGKRRRWTAAVAAAAALVLIIGGVGYTYGIGGSGESSQSAGYEESGNIAENDGNIPSSENDGAAQLTENDGSTEALESSDNPYVVVAANYPANSVTSTAYSENYPDSYSVFVDTLSKTMLTQDADSNQVYSPLNIYLALAMLAEVTEGNSRTQILQVLGNEDMDSLRTQTNALWTGNYRTGKYQNEDNQISILGSSLWLNENLTYHTDTVRTLAEQYYASVYQGQLGSEEFTEEMIKWVNEQTGDFLQEQAEEVLKEENEDSEQESDNDEQSTTKDETISVASLVTTIYYKVDWAQQFSEELTSTATFHGTSQDTECDFMNQTIAQTTYYEGERFGAIFKRFYGGGGMWLILPDEDSSVSELLEGEELYGLLDTSSALVVDYTSEWENCRSVKLNLSMPKFDISSNWYLQETLALLGITDVFDEKEANLSALTDNDAYISKIVHAARIAVDEYGLTAAAFTEIESSDTSDMPGSLEELDFVLDRPFVYAVVSDTGTILFMGTVNQL